MKIAVGGIGEIGESFCKLLCKKRYSVTGFDINRELLNEKEDIYEVNFEAGNISDVQFLSKAKINTFEYYIAATNNYATNLCSTSMAKAMGCRFVVARVNSNEHFNKETFNLQKHFNIDLTFDPNRLCAFEIAKIIRGPERTSIENFTRNSIEARQFFVKKHSKLTNNPLHQLKICSNVRIINISRNNKHEIPNGNSIILPGDIITVVGTNKDIELIKKECSDLFRYDNTCQITVCGQIEILAGLVKFLSSPKYKITFVEKDISICEKVSQQFYNVTVINGDCTSITFLKEEQICCCDYFVSAFNNDEQNIMCGIQAKHLGTGNSITLLNSKNYDSLMQSSHKNFGIDHIISKTAASVAEISTFVSEKAFNEILHLGDINISLVEFRIDKQCCAIGKKIKDLGLPPNCILVSLIHNFIAQIPSGNDEIYQGDRIICATTQDSLKPLINILT